MVVRSIAKLSSAVLACVFLTAAPLVLAAQRPDPLGQLVTEALRTNLGLEGERLAERRVAAEVREARGLFFPSLGLQSRYSRLGGVPNIGDLINPAYATLNQLTSTNRFPTNINFTLPQRHESRLELVQPIFNAGILANYSVARARAAGQRMQLAAAARQLAADVQVAYLEEASARRAVEIYEATLLLVQENERVAERLLGAGSATPEAVFRARAERADVDQQLAEARERKVAAARALLRRARSCARWRRACTPLRVPGVRRPRRSSPACPWRWITGSRVPTSRSVRAMISGSRQSSCRGTSSTAAATLPDGPRPATRPIAPGPNGKISRTGSRSRFARRTKPRR